MQVQKEVGQHYHDAVSAIRGHGVPEDTLPYLGVPYYFTKRWHRSLFHFLVGRLKFREQVS
jgi:hypothetical protein